MNQKLNIIEISIPHFTLEGTFQSAAVAMEGAADAGFNAVLMLPFMPIDHNLSRSPYALIDHKAVDQAMGTVEDVCAWIERCHELGLDVVLDIPLNHTSPSHRWKSQPDWYSSDASGKAHAPVGTDWSDVHQLNHRNPLLVEELQSVLEFWLEIGFDGFRYDAAAWMEDACIAALIENANLKSGHKLHHWCDSRDMMAKHPFTAYLDHRSYQLMASGKDIDDELPENGTAIRYLTNHDTLQQGRSAKEIFGSRYPFLREQLHSSECHVMQSACEWMNPETVYSFLR